MQKKKFIVHISGPSCSGKSSLFAALAEKYPGSYLVSYDKLKWQLSGYHRDRDTKTIRAIHRGVFEAVCKLGLPILLDKGYNDKSEFAAFQRVGRRHGYRFVHIALHAPLEVLLKRFRERVKRAKKGEGKISVTNEKLYLKNLSREWFVPRGTPVHDTSRKETPVIAAEVDKLLKGLFRHARTKKEVATIHQ